MAKLRWGILAAGRIAGAFARGVAHSTSGELVAIGSRSQAKAEAFANEHRIPRRHGSYEALLADPEVEAVYIATPHPMHMEWVLKAAAAKKHILCEKPIGLNAKQAKAMIAAAKKHDVFLMEAFMYRCHPQIAKLVDLLRNRAIGDVGLIQATFGFQAGFDPKGRLFAPELGGGGILDVGCYAVSMARLVAGVAMGGESADPVEVRAVGHLGETGVDEWTVADLKFPGDTLAQCCTAVRFSPENAARIFGTEGKLVVPDPWIPNREGGVSALHVTRGGHTEEIRVESPGWLYGLEADVVAANLANRQAKFPAMNWADTLGNMRTLDLWRKAIGLTYPAEKS